MFALPTKWVYKYKFDEMGKLVRFKARLVVCGNRQNTDFWRETYAAVARSTTLKILLALVATLDLECDQLDVVTVFLNSWFDKDEDVYIRLPDGRLSKLRKASYADFKPEDEMRRSKASNTVFFVLKVYSRRRHVQIVVLS
jgi:hypothetical protein